ncbi:hypothetical protein [Streptomyces sp. AK02-04a]|uniref:hypothetical protein n=1 Tax=Streptomyces sp. AK02-04a TaxID=3028649 RepID=UPI0029A1A021|nr:hypothetical protein [Streptomyces sp. AK02-04a]MDX3757239.1 hypothetical protein [Streptomyces sp. AK02-04a]
MMPGTIAERTTKQFTGVPLVERRREGETFPRIPVGSVELTREQAAAGLFAQRAELDVLPVDWQLLDALAVAVENYGVAGLDALVPELEARSEGDREAGDAFGRAYYLCREHWYEGGLSSYLEQSDMAVALYASDLPQDLDIPVYGSAVLVDGHLFEGVSRVGAAALVRVGPQVAGEFGAPWLHIPAAQRSVEYRRLMPNRARRRFCYNTAVNRCADGPRPVMVWFDDGGYAVGGIPAPDPRRRKRETPLRQRAAAVREGRA